MEFGLKKEYNSFIYGYLKIIFYCYLLEMNRYNLEKYLKYMFLEVVKFYFYEYIFLGFFGRWNDGLVNLFFYIDKIF